jgi:hypothetical protein
VHIRKHLNGNMKNAIHQPDNEICCIAKISRDDVRTLIHLFVHILMSVRISVEKYVHGFPLLDSDVKHLQNNFKNVRTLANS